MDWTVPQDFAAYTEAEHGVWRTLYTRQRALLPSLACDAFLDGLETLDLAAGIPDFTVLSARLRELTGWQVVAVPGLVPDEVFFEHLANRRFPAGRFIRTPEQLDYLQEPDVFHDVFGHVPMLADPVFADYMQAYGQGGMRALGLGRLHNLARLYWYTVEFGLLRTRHGLRIYGAGIVSSATESRYALTSPLPVRIGFSLPRVMQTPYVIDDVQKMYFVVDSLQTLLDVTQKTDFAPLYTSLAQAQDIPIGTILAQDTAFAANE
jgi:phenylalanine-4-hydroxylase